MARPSVASELIIADHRSAYVEHLVGGGVFAAPETVTGLDRLFTTMRSEAYRASDSVAVIRKAEEVWTGEQQKLARPTDRA